MLKKITALLVLIVLSCSSAHAQQRVKKQGPEDFDAIYKKVGEAWNAESFGQATSAARALLELIGLKRSEAILAALPAAPEGYAIVPQKKKRQASNNPLAGMAAAIGNVIKQRYRPSEGGRELEVTVTADSPMAQMFKMWMTNPAALGPDAELVKYNEYDAVLKKQGKGWNIQILIDKDVAEVKAPDRDDEFLLGWINQAAVDNLAAALGK